MRSVFSHTRRRILSAFLAFPLVSVARSPAWARPDPEEQLRIALAEMQLPWAAELRLIRFEEGATGAEAVLTAVVEMHWPPGMRRRRFVVRDAVPDFAMSRLVGDIDAEFGSVA